MPKPTQNNTVLLMRYPKINSWHGQYVFGMLPFFDSVGFFYAIETPNLPGVFKIGVTARDAALRAAEVTKEFNLTEPFRVTFELHLLNYRMAETFAHSTFKECRTEYVKSVDHFVCIRNGTPATRTHRSAEVFKCSPEKVAAIFQSVSTGDERVRAFEADLLLNSEKWFSDFEGLYPNAIEILFSWKAVNQAMRTRLGQRKLNIKVPALDQRIDQGDLFSLCQK